MPPKSRRNRKKYAGQRRPEIAQSRANVATSPRPSTPGAMATPVTQPKSGGPRLTGQMAPSISGANVGRELRTIAVLAVVAVTIVVVLSFVLR